MQSLTKLAVIILNYNSYELSIHAARNIQALDGSIKIIIVDNCSKDNSAEMLNEEFNNDSDVSVVLNKENLGYANGNNVGIRYALTLDVDTILIMNPDITVDNREILEKLYTLLNNHPQIGAATVSTIFNGKINKPNECAWMFMNKLQMLFSGTLLKKLVHNCYYPNIVANSEGYALVDIVQGCFFMIKLENMKKINYFDDNTFLYCEEAILARRLQSIGLHNAVLPSLFIHHNHKEKNKKLQKYDNKRFDMNCYYNSRKYYIRNYSGESKIYIKLTSLYLSVDYYVKLCCLKVRKAIGRIK